MFTAPPQIREYTIPEIRTEMEMLRRSYQVVRLVDAEECRTLDPDRDGHVLYGAECHSVWNSAERCTNCSSYQAAMTHTTRFKTEFFQGRQFDITSVPVYLRLESMEIIPCCST